MFKLNKNSHKRDENMRKNIFVGLFIISMALIGFGQSYATSIITGLVKTGGDTDPAPYYPMIVKNGLVPGAISYVDREGRATWHIIPPELLSQKTMIRILGILERSIL